MRVLIGVLGTMGDLVPAMALASSLRERGHDPTIACENHQADVVAEFGLSRTRLGTVSAEQWRRGWQLAAKSSHLTERALIVDREIYDFQSEILLHQLQRLAPAYDVIVVNTVLLNTLPQWQPLRHPRLAVLHPTLLSRRDAFFLSQRSSLTLVAASPTLFPELRGLSGSLIVTGGWSAASPGSRGMPASVEQFLNAGTPPLYVSLGSFAALGGDEFLATVTSAVSAIGARALIDFPAEQGARRDTSSDIMLLSRPVAHSLLLPRVAAVVHQGGAGTATAVLRAGLPSVILPQHPEQVAVAACVEKLGAATAALLPTDLTASNLARDLHAVRSDRSFANAGLRAAQAMLLEPGVAFGARALEQFSGSALS